MFDTASIITILAIVGSGLLSGLYFVFSNFAMKALRSLEPEAGIMAMQKINEDIVNPLFAAIFFGTPLLSLYLVIKGFSGAFGEGGVWLIVGGLVHIVGNLLVTGVGNVPLNNRLAAVDPVSEEGRKMWQEYHSKWVPLNHIRTIATATATGLLAIGLTFLL